MVTMTPNTPRMPVRRYLYTLMATVAVCWIVLVPIFVYVMRWVMGFSTSAIILVLVVWGTIISTSTLYGFYKGCVRYYGLKGDDRLLPLEGRARDLMDRLKPGP